MAAPENNKNAETLTRDTAIDLAKKALGIINEETFFLSDVASKCGTYRTKFNYILQKFADDEEVKDLIEQMYNNCEAILMMKAATNKINPVVGIFALKCYHSLMETNVVRNEFDASDLQNLYKRVMSSNDTAKTTQ